MRGPLKKDFIAISDYSSAEIIEILKLAKTLKSRQKNQERYTPLEGKSLVMIFQKPSARTRVSFETGMFQLGGHAIYLETNKSKR